MIRTQNPLPRGLGRPRLGQINSQQATSAINEGKERWEAIKTWRATVEKLDPTFAKTLGDKAKEFLDLYTQTEKGLPYIEQTLGQVSAAHPLDTRFIDSNQAEAVSKWTADVAKMKAMVDQAGKVSAAASSGIQPATASAPPAAAPQESWFKRALTPKNLVIGAGGILLLGVLGYLAFREKK